MVTAILSKFQGTGLMARALRSSVWIVGGFGFGQFLRLLSNLILTRILFPEAFGLLALVSVFVVGLQLFSDIGINTSVYQNKRGDDPNFLLTAWTLQVSRGILLSVLAALIAYPVSQFYGEPDLAYLLPIAGLTLAITGFRPSRVLTAGRHLMIGRLTMAELIGQALGLAVMVPAALITKSVYALVVGGVSTALFQLILINILIPGPRDRFRFDKSAAWDMIHFGKWLFLSTIAAFFVQQGDKLVLGKFVPIEILGIYKIGYFFATFPNQTGQMLVARLLIPIYREKPPRESHENFRKLRRMRILLSCAVIGFASVMALAGPWLIETLYDPRYALAGPMLVIGAISIMPDVILLSYSRAALAAGDSRGFFFATLCRALMYMAFLTIGIMLFGLVGGMFGMLVALVISYPFYARIAARQGAWDPKVDLMLAVLVIALDVAILSYHSDAIMGLYEATRPAS